ncbi:hypothetical protein D3C81_2101600 [compost metagenome]
MGHGHFRQAAHQQQGNDCADRVAQQHAGPRIADGVGAAHEQPGTDCSANGDHAHLPRGQLPPQALLALGNRVKATGFAHVSVLWILFF